MPGSVPADAIAASGERAERPTLWVVAGSVSAALIGSLLWLHVFSRALGPIGGYSDYRVHARMAKSVLKGEWFDLPHPLYHWLVVVVHALNPAWGLGRAGVAVVLVSQAALLALVQRTLRTAMNPGPPARLFALSVGLAVAVTFVDPLYWVTPDEIYFGYIFSNTFHNPTSLLLRPLAFALFLVTLRLWSRPSWPWVLGAAALTVASALAKPSHLICFLPAVGLMLLAEGPARLWPLQRETLAVLAGVVAPAVVTLAAQWRLGTTGPIHTAVAWAPFRVVFEHTPPSVPKLGLKLVLSIAFPLTVTLMRWRPAVRDRTLKLAWLSFAFGALYTYALAELGPRLRDGNFLWSGQVTCFILMVASLAFLLSTTDWRSRAGRLQAAAGAAVFVVQVGSGIAYVLEYLRSGRII